MKSFKKVSLILIFILFAIGSTLLLKNSKTITNKQKLYAITKISYSDSFTIPDVNSSADFNKLLKNKPTAAGAVDLINMVSSITKESVKSTISSKEHPLPLLAHWNTGDISTGMTPTYIMNLINEGNHILPSWKLKTYWQKQLPETYYKASILKAKELNLPLTFIMEPFEDTLTDNSHYFGLPIQNNPNVIDLNSVILNKLSPFGPNDLWSEVGKNFSNSKLLKSIQSWYPNPPLVMFVDNSTPKRLSWNELDNSKRFVDRFGSNTNDNFKHIVINAYWIEKYRQLHESFKKNLTDTWRKNTRFIAYNPISLNIGDSENWINSATLSNYDFSIYPLMSDAISVQYFTDNSTQSINNAVFKLNNLPFVINQAHKQNSTFSFQLSISDGGYLDNLDKYRGFAQLALWLTRPNIIREFNDKTNNKTTIMSRFKAIMDSVELIYNDKTLQYFWKYGKLVANNDKKIGETSNVPSYYSKSDRWFLLNVDANPQGKWTKDENIPVFAIALEAGTEPNRKWLLFTQSLSGDLKDIVVTIPDYGDIVTDSSAKGNFYIISEDGSSTLIPSKQTVSAPVEQTVSAPVEQTVSAPVEQTVSAPVEQTVSAPVEQTVSAITKKTPPIDFSNINLSSAIGIQTVVDKLIKSTTAKEKQFKNYTPKSMPRYGKEFFVSPSGSDSYTGTIDKPFATLVKARDSIRTYKKTNGLPNGGIVVWIRKGTYSFPKSFMLTKQDSGEKGKPIAYRSYNNEKVRIIGGVDLDSNWFQPVTSKDPVWNRLDINARKHIQVINLKAHRITDLGKLMQDNRIPSITPLELFEDDHALNLARWPDNGVTTTYLPSSKDSKITIYGDLQPNITGTYTRQNGKKPIYKKDTLVNGEQYYISRMEGKTTNDSRSWIISKKDNRPLWIHYNGGYNLPREFIPAYKGGKGIPSLLKPGSKQFGFTFTAEGLNDTSFKYSENNPSHWRNTGDIWINSMLQYAWRNNHTRIKSIDTANKIIHLEKKPLYGIKKGKFKKAYYAYNILEELTTPGEYYIDRNTYKLYVWPENSIKDTKFSVSLNKHIVVYLNNASWVEFHGVIMEIARERVCVIAGGKHNLITNSKLRFSGKALLDILSGSYNGITYSELTGSGNEVIDIAGGIRSSLTPSHNFVVNNDIHHNNRWNWTSKEAVRIYGVGNIVEHNNIHDFTHQAISFSGNNNLIEYNNIYNALTYAEDAGVIYSGRHWGWRGNKINYNFIHDIDNNYGGYSLFGIYFDDSLSENEAVGNIFSNIDGYGVFIHNGRDNKIENNIFCNVATAYIGTNNATSPEMLTYILQKLKEDKINYKSEPWASAYPKLATMPRDIKHIKSDGWLYPSGNSFQNNIGTGYLSWYRGMDKNNFQYYSHFDKKPLSRDSSKFTLIPYEKIGIENN